MFRLPLWDKQPGARQSFSAQAGVHATTRSQSTVGGARRPFNHGATTPATPLRAALLPLVVWLGPLFCDPHPHLHSSCFLDPSHRRLLSRTSLASPGPPDPLSLSCLSSRLNFGTTLLFLSKDISSHSPRRLDPLRLLLTISHHIRTSPRQPLERSRSTHTTTSGSTPAWFDTLPQRELSACLSPVFRS